MCCRAGDAARQVYGQRGTLIVSSDPLKLYLEVPVENRAPVQPLCCPDLLGTFVIQCQGWRRGAATLHISMLPCYNTSTTTCLPSCVATLAYAQCRASPALPPILRNTLPRLGGRRAQLLAQPVVHKLLILYH